MMERKNQRTVAKREEEVPEEVACLRLAESVGGGHGFAVGVSRFCNDFSQRKGFGLAPTRVFCRAHVPNRTAPQLCVRNVIRSYRGRQTGRLRGLRRDYRVRDVDSATG